MFLLVLGIFLCNFLFNYWGIFNWDTLFSFLQILIYYIKLLLALFCHLNTPSTFFLIYFVILIFKLSLCRAIRRWVIADHALVVLVLVIVRVWIHALSMRSLCLLFLPTHLPNFLFRFPEPFARASVMPFVLSCFMDVLIPIFEQVD